jgi:integrase/recombinase XerC
MPDLLSSAQSFTEYLKYEKRYSANTIISYQTDLQHFSHYIKSQFDVADLSQVNHSFVRSWLASLKDDKLTSRSINRKISALKSFFKYHLRTGNIEATPMANIISPKTGRRLPLFIKEEDTKQMINTLKNSAENWKTLNAKMLVTIFYSTGMRLSELINLKEKQIDFSLLQIKVLGKGNKERIIPVSNDLLEDIKEYIGQKKKNFDPGKLANNFLLITEKGGKIYPKYAWLLVNKYVGAATSLQKKSPHVLRHSFATHLMNNGAGLNAVKELLGHSSLASTQVYTHTTIEKLKNVYKNAHPKA